MSTERALSPRSGFLWAFVLGRGHHPRKRSAARGIDRSPTVSVVIPTLNEAENLEHVLPKIPSWVNEVVLVDGFSTDDTIDVARRLMPSIHVVMQQGRGKGAALRTGFAAASGDIVVMMDADGSTDPDELPAFVGTLLSGADFVKGSRFIQGAGTADMGWMRRFGNWVFVTLVRLLFGGCYSDLCYGYMAFWRNILPQLALSCDGFEIETMMSVRALKAGLRVMEVPSFEEPRIHGNSNLRAIPDGWRVLKTIFRERLSWPTPTGIGAARRLTLSGRVRGIREPVAEPVDLAPSGREFAAELRGR